MYVDSSVENLPRFRMNQEKKRRKIQQSFYLNSGHEESINPLGNPREIHTPWRREHTMVRHPPPAGSPALNLGPLRNRNSCPDRQWRGG